MLEQAFADVYSKFKLHFYQKVYSRSQVREASLPTEWTYCMELMQALGTPTINELARIEQLSQPKAAK